MQYSDFCNDSKHEITARLSPQAKGDLNMNVLAVVKYLQTVPVRKHSPMCLLCLVRTFLFQVRKTHKRSIKNILLVKFHIKENSACMLKAFN